MALSASTSQIRSHQILVELMISLAKLIEDWLCGKLSDAHVQRIDNIPGRAVSLWWIIYTVGGKYVIELDDNAITYRPYAQSRPRIKLYVSDPEFFDKLWKLIND
jgi:hypothetical protein